MADAAVLPNPNAKRVIGLTSIKEAAANFKRKLEEYKNSIVDTIQEKVDEVKTKRAEKKYDKIRGELIMGAAHYTEKQYEKYVKELEKIQKMQPHEIRAAYEAAMNAQNKESIKGYKKVITTILAGLSGKLLKTGATMLVEGGLTSTVAGTVATTAGAVGLGTAVSADVVASGIGLVAEGAVGETLKAALVAKLAVTFGLTSTLATALLTGGVALLILSGVAAYKIHKHRQSKKGLEAKKLLSDKDFLQSFEGLVNDIKALTTKLDQTRAEWVQKAKTMKTKEFKVEYAKYVDGVVAELNLKNLDRSVIQSVFGEVGKEVEAPAVEAETPKEETAEKEEEAAEETAESTTTTTVTATETTVENQQKQQEAQRLQAEQAAREEAARREAEANAVEEERE